MGRALDWAIFSIIIVVMGTGLNNMVPGLAYILAGVGVVNLLFKPRVLQVPAAFFRPTMVAGFILFNSFFWAHGFFSPLETRIYFVHVLSMAMLLLAYAYGTFLLRRGKLTGGAGREMGVAVVAVGALAVLLLGQIGEMAGYVDLRPGGLGGYGVDLFFRPGGFLNSNMTAAIALVFLFVVARLNWAGRTLVAVAAVALTTVVVLLSQSRAAIIVLVPYLLFLASRRGRIFMFAAPIALVVLLVFSAPSDDSEVSGLLEIVGSRFEGDFSSDQRLFELGRGLSAFSDAPLLGNGYRYLTQRIGSSAHNEIVENLANFGIVGVTVLVLACYFLYWPASLVFFGVCIVPTLMFSHNFFDTVPLQVALGLALTVDRSRVGVRSGG